MGAFKRRISRGNHTLDEFARAAEGERGMKENCGNCRNRFKLWKSDYSKGGCEHSHPDGYICMAFANEGIAEWMVGLEEEHGMCECYQSKESES